VGCLGSVNAERFQVGPVLSAIGSLLVLDETLAANKVDRCAVDIIFLDEMDELAGRDLSARRVAEEAIVGA